MNRLLPTILILIVVAFAACRKTQVIPILKSTDVVIDSNQAPADTSVSYLLMANYVNKVYIASLGREPITSEFNTGIDILTPSNMSIASRKTLVGSILGKPGYEQRIFDSNSAEFLQSVDSTDIDQIIYAYTLFLLDSNNMAQWAFGESEKLKLEELRDIPLDLVSGLAIPEMHKRMVNNYFYDQINMGTDNFVTSCFQNFVNRYPTESELEQSTFMVDGMQAIVFFNTGTTKDEFIDNFFGSENYFEQQVNNLYKKYLYRDASSVEMTTGAVEYMSTMDFDQQIINVLSSDEFAGI